MLGSPAWAQDSSTTEVIEQATDLESLEESATEVPQESAEQPSSARAADEVAPQEDLPRPVPESSTRHEGPAGEGPIIEMPEEGESVGSGEHTPEGAATPDEAPPNEERRTLPIGGYGELHYNLRRHGEGEDASSVLDLHRMVLFVGHQFSRGFSFHLELEVEHAFVAGEDSPGEVALEQAFVDWRFLGNSLGLRAGIVLVPMGAINLYHEPPTFHGVERPMVDKVIIPSTWREGGIGIFGEPVPGLRYQLYLVSGLDPTGFSLGSGIRGGRQNVGKASMNGFGVTGRLEYQPVPQLTVGLGFYVGQSGGNAEGLSATCDTSEPDDVTCQDLDVDVWVGGGALDVRFQWRGLEARAVVAFMAIGDTGALRSAFDHEGNPAGLDMSPLIFGSYVELAWDVLTLASTSHMLLPFVRYEFYDTTFRHDDPTIEGSRATHDLVVGLTYRPIRQIALKADVIFRNPGSGDILFDLGVGWMF